MWTKVRNDKDVTKLMQLVNNFHDSCIKEMHYVSGAFVNEKYAMNPHNKINTVSIILQRQSRQNPVIEMKFIDVKKCTFFPKEENHADIIFEASLEIKNESIRWIKDQRTNNEDINEQETLIISKRMEWRFLESCLGDDMIYTQKG